MSRIPRGDSLDGSTAGGRRQAASDDSQVSGKEVADQKEARRRLLRAFELTRHHPVIPVYRRVCEALALCHAHHPRDAWQAAFYICEAQSITFRHNALVNLSRKLRKITDDTSSGNTEPAGSPLDGATLRTELQAMREQLSFGQDEERLKQCVQCLPPEWTVVQLCVVRPAGHPGGRLLLCQLRSDGSDPLVLTLPAFTSQEGDRLVMEFEAIVRRSRETMGITEKVQWWAERQRLDEMLKELLSRLEYQWLGGWRGAFFGKLQLQADRERLARQLEELLDELRSLTSDAVCVHRLQLLLECAHTLTDHELVQTLTRLTPPGHTWSDDVIKQCADAVRAAASKVKVESCPREPVILILDKEMQQLPWENLPSLQAQPFTRLPSLHFLAAHYTQLSANPNSVYVRGVAPSSVYYVINPESNLTPTQEKFQTWFANEEGWSGSCGSRPTSEQIVKAVTEHDLFIYAGHGTGSKFLSADSLQQQQCRAAVLLMGCSSGRLQAQGCLDPTGMMLHYFLAGCPCVVANLWDVTDRDIDRYLETVLQSWLNGGTGSQLLHAVHMGRQACKLRYMIGAAPVVYGLPVSLATRERPAT